MTKKKPTKHSAAVRKAAKEMGLSPDEIVCKIVGKGKNGTLKCTPKKDDAEPADEE